MVGPGQAHAAEADGVDAPSATPERPPSHPENLPRDGPLRLARRHAAARRVARRQNYAVADAARLYEHLVAAVRAVGRAVEGDFRRIRTAAVPALPGSESVLHDSPLSRRRPATGESRDAELQSRSVGGDRKTQGITQAGRALEPWYSRGVLASLAFCQTRSDELRTKTFTRIRGAAPAAFSAMNELPAY